jgi:hypothetical protein
VGASKQVVKQGRWDRTALAEGEGVEAALEQAVVVVAM